MNTTPQGKVWLVATKATGSVWTFERQADGTWTNRGSLGAGGWTTTAPPGMAVDNDGDVTIALTKQGTAAGGAVHSYRRCSTCVQWHHVGQVGVTSEWSTAGTLSMVAAPDDRVWLAAVKQGGGASGTTMWSVVFTPDSTDNHLGSWSGAAQRGNGGWSQHAAPAITAAAGGTVFLTAIKTDGNAWAFRRNASTGDWSNYGQIGGNGWAGKAP
jgi:hypothetical protein